MITVAIMSLFRRRPSRGTAKSESAEPSAYDQDIEPLRALLIAEERRAATLSELTSLMAKGEDPLEFAQRSVELTAHATQAGGSLIYLWNPESERLVSQAVTQGAKRSLLGSSIQLRMGEGLTGWAAMMRQTVALNHDVVTDPRWSKLTSSTELADLEDSCKSIVVVPILEPGGDLLGVFSLFAGHESAFAPADVRLASEVGVLLASGLTHAQAVSQLRSTSLALQRSLLPQRPPARVAVEVAWRYRPAGAHAGVGGDWFDVIPLSGARVAMVVGDVVGHGLSASATMGRLRTAVRTIADLDLPPDELLAHLDGLVAQFSIEAESQTLSPASSEGLAGVGATCLYAVYDPIAGRCTLASAGHPPPVFISPEGVVRLLDVPSGPPLGVGGLPIEVVDIELPEGSLLALYTDGLIERRTHDLDAGLGALCQALAHGAPSLEMLSDNVLEALLPERPRDDVVLLLARPHPLTSDSVVTWELFVDPAVVAQARADVSNLMAAWGLEELSFVTELVVSELVTNAFRYGSPPIHLRLIKDRTLICEVFDGNSTSPYLRRAKLFDEGGRGLLLVAQLTSRWGTRHTREGKTIWAEQPLPDY